MSAASTTTAIRNASRRLSSLITKLSSSSSSSTSSTGTLNRAAAASSSTSSFSTKSNTFDYRALARRILTQQHNNNNNNNNNNNSKSKSSDVRSYSKSLGTDGGLKPDQVLVPESYIVHGNLKAKGPEDVQISKKRVFAVCSVGSHQHKVSPDDLFFVEKLHGANVNDVVELTRVLMVGSAKRTIIGRPIVENARVMCLVEEVVKDEKTIIFKKRRRKYSRRWNGARAILTSLRVTDVIGIEED
jgi:large subunit ribosomal protein L21